MASELNNYQCPSCTGPLKFSPDTGNLSCEFCGSQYDLAQIEELYREKENAAAEAAQKSDQWDTSDLTEDWGADGDNMRTYNCPSCTAELMCEETTAATGCPYCGNPTVIPGQFHGSLKPDYVLPFKLEKKDAVEALKKHYGKRFFLPKYFKEQNHIEKVQGIYVPFWLFDAEVEGSANYKATRTRSYREGDYRVTDTMHYHVNRAGNMTFEKVPVDASSKMPDEHMDSIEPFHYDELKPFSMAYLPGFLADKYDVTVDQSKSRADLRCENTFDQELRDTVLGYHSVVQTGSRKVLYRGKVHYALMPVWLLNTKWNGKDFLFAMNGQTGKMAGDLPVDKKKFWGMFFGLGAALSVISSLLILLL